MKLSGIITLTTDFGERDGFVGVMKGIILGINPKAKIIDITNEIERQNIDQAAFVIKNSFSFFPEGTIHIVIVDPGVGSLRRIIVIDYTNYVFLAPDNGVLKYVLSEKKNFRVYDVVNKDYFLKNVSSTFHGRDIFAPVSAYLSLGTDIEKFGPEVSDYIKGESFEPFKKGNKIIGKVIYCDRFGNIITNVKKDEVPEKYQEKDISINIKDLNIKEISRFYSDGGKNRPIALFGSSGFLEIAVYLGNAEKSLDVKIGDSVNLSFN